MEINFLKHQCVNLQPLVVGDAVAKQVDNYKLLGVYISSDLSWKEYVDFIVKKATKRLYSLKVLRKASVQQADLVRIYCSLIRSVLEYGTYERTYRKVQEFYSADQKYASYADAKRTHVFGAHAFLNARFQTRI